MTKTIEGTVVDAAEVDDLDIAYTEIARAPYRFRWSGQEWTLPHMADLDFRLQAEIESMSEYTIDAIDKLFARIFGGDQAARFAAIPVPGPMLAMLFERWLKYSGSIAGESEASNESSENTGTSSRPTSVPSTDSGSPKLSTAKRAPRKRASPRAKSST